MTVQNVEREENGRMVLTIEVGSETFGAAVSRVYRQKISKMNIPGFRKGKAPRKIVESMYGKGVFYEDAVNDTYRTAYDEAVKQKNLKPVELPDIDISSIGEEGYVFTAKFYVYPEVEIGNYKGLRAVMPPAEVDEEMVEGEIERLRERNASLSTVERPAAMGDTVVFDYEGLLEGVAFEGGTSENASLELGSGRFIPGFEEKLVGAAAGEERDIELSFPEEYHAENLAGKEVLFRCKIHEVKEKVKPEADDEFAKDVSEFDTLEEYKNSIRERFMKNARDSADQSFENALIDQLIEGLQCDIPPCMVEARTEELLGDLEHRVRHSGMDLDTYCRITGQTEEIVRGEYEAVARRQVQTSLIFDEIARREEFTLSEEEINAEITRLAELYKMKEEDVRGRIHEEELRRDLLALKASKLVIAEALRLSPEEAAEQDKGENKESKGEESAAETEG